MNSVVAPLTWDACPPRHHWIPGQQSTEVLWRTTFDLFLSFVSSFFFGGAESRSFLSSVRAYTLWGFDRHCKWVRASKGEKLWAAVRHDSAWGRFSFYLFFPFFWHSIRTDSCVTPRCLRSVIPNNHGHLLDPLHGVQSIFPSQLSKHPLSMHPSVGPSILHSTFPSWGLGKHPSNVTVLSLFDFISND